MRFPWAKKRKWAILIAAPAKEAGQHWGDTWFARDLAAALNRAGEDAKVVTRTRGDVEARDADDVVLVLRGLRRFVPRHAKTQWFMWVISHPDLLEPGEVAEYDAVFAASLTWTHPEAEVIPLLQATNPERFHPGLATTGTGADVLFVGSTRSQYRQIIQDAIAADVNVEIHGRGWDAFIDPKYIASEYLSGDEVGAAYRSANVVLNDHWADMARDGFLSNRLFDAVAAGASVVSDEALGLHDVFGDAVITYSSPENLADAIERARAKTEAARLSDAARIAREHSFDVRAKVLIEVAKRGKRG